MVWIEVRVAMRERPFQRADDCNFKLEYMGFLVRALKRWRCLNNSGRTYANVPGLFLADPTISSDRRIPASKWLSFVDRAKFIRRAALRKLWLMRGCGMLVLGDCAVLPLDRRRYYRDWGSIEFESCPRVTGVRDDVFVFATIFRSGHVHHDLFAGFCLLRELVPNATMVVSEQVYALDFSFRELMGMLGPQGLCVARRNEAILARRVYTLGYGGAVADTPFAIDALRRFMAVHLGLWKVPATRYVVLQRERGSNGRVIGNLAAVRRRLARGLPGLRVELLVGRLPCKRFTVEQQIREAATFKLFCSAEGSNCIPLLYMAERGIFMEINYDVLGPIWTRVAAWLGHFHVMLRIPEMEVCAKGVFQVNMSQVERALPCVLAFLETTL